MGQLRLVAFVAVVGLLGGVSVALPGVTQAAPPADTNTVIALGATPNVVVVSPVDDSAYVTDQGSMSIREFSPSTNSIINPPISVPSPAFSAAMSPDGTRLYATLSQDDSVAVINTATRAVVATVATGDWPVGIVISPSGTRGYVTNLFGNTVSVLDLTPGSEAVIDTIAVGQGPYLPALSPDGAVLYVPNYFDNTVSFIRTSDGTPLAGPVSVTTGPRQVAVSPDGNSVYVTCQQGNRLEVISMAVPTVPTVAASVPASSPVGVVVGKGGGRLFLTSPGNDMVSAINSTTFMTEWTNQTQFFTGPMYPGLSADGSRLYVPEFDGGGVSIFTTGLRTVTFNPNGSPGSVQQQYGYSTTPLAANVYSDPGLVFAGWSTSAGTAPVEYVDQANYAFNDDTVLYAQWTVPPTTFTVTFDPNGGTGTMAQQTASAPTALTANAFTRSGYNFAGWNTAQAGNGTPYGNQAVFPFTADDTLYAQWTAIAPPLPRPTFPPSAPQQVTATVGDASAVISWRPPVSDGTFPITQYEVEVTPGGHTCLVPATTPTCTITGLSNGTAYTATVRALNGAGWGPHSSPGSAFTPTASEPPVPVTITITGSRTEVRGKPGVVVTGSTTGVEVRTGLRPWFRFPGQTGFTQGVSPVLVQEDGKIRWQRQTGKRITVVITSADGSVESNAVTIGAR